ncbi:MAG: hypothetical protein FJ190_02170 [Gammaproteobacteria bacterium]|nr:hypothetical protein [Gammaproteobacteria bacterium]
MRSQCPDCGKLYPVTKKQLRAPKTQVYCTQCKKKFIVAEILVEKTAKTAEANAFNQKKK